MPIPVLVGPAATTAVAAFADSLTAYGFIRKDREFHEFQIERRVGIIYRHPCRRSTG